MSLNSNNYTGNTPQNDGYMNAEGNNLWMEHLEKDARGPMRQEDNTTTRGGKYSQDECSASYTVRDGNSADDSLPHEKTRSRYEDVEMGMLPNTKTPSAL